MMTASCRKTSPASCRDIIVADSQLQESITVDDSATAPLLLLQRVNSRKPRQAEIHRCWKWRSSKVNTRFITTIHASIDVDSGQLYMVRIRLANKMIGNREKQPQFAATCEARKLKIKIKIKAQVEKDDDQNCIAEMRPETAQMSHRSQK